MSGENQFANNILMGFYRASLEQQTKASFVLYTGSSGKTVRYAYGACDERYLHLAPNNLLMWTAIAWSCEQGYQTFDMGRTAYANEGLMEFKRRWGDVKEPLPYNYYTQVTGLSTTPENSWRFCLLTTCWRQLPLQVAGPLGGYIYKHLG